MMKIFRGNFRRPESGGPYGEVCQSVRIFNLFRRETGHLGAFGSLHIMHGKIEQKILILNGANGSLQHLVAPVFLQDCLLKDVLILQCKHGRRTNLSLSGVKILSQKFFIRQP